MNKYKVFFQVIVMHETEVEANSVEEAEDAVRNMNGSDVIQDFAESFPRDLSNSVIEAVLIQNKTEPSDFSETDITL